MLSVEDVIVVRQYLISFANENNMSAMTYENMLCKLKVLYFDNNGDSIMEDWSFAEWYSRVFLYFFYMLA